jgi:hypothetical protein
LKANAARAHLVNYIVEGHRDTSWVYKRLVLGAPADLERSEFDVFNFALISDIDSLNPCSRRTKVDGPLAATTSSSEPDEEMGRRGCTHNWLSVESDELIATPLTLPPWVGLGMRR